LSTPPFSTSHLRTHKVLLSTWVAGGLALTGGSMGGCAQILGVTDGSPYPDGSESTSDVTIDARAGTDASDGDDANDVRIDGAGKPECHEMKGFCEKRCGKMPDNCGDIVDCRGCDGGFLCTEGACGCVPDSIAVTCRGHDCGMLMNNCGQSVACGSGGTSRCEHATDICEADGSTCCTPDPAAVTCANRCVTLENNCGQSVDCDCADSGLCLSGVCCAPISEAEWCANRCGVLDNNCGQSVDCGECDACSYSDAGACH
jgi:hypothetical protein